MKLKPAKLPEPRDLQVSSVVFARGSAAIVVTLMSTENKPLHTWALQVGVDRAQSLEVNRKEQILSFAEMFAVNQVGVPLTNAVGSLAMRAGGVTTEDICDAAEEWLTQHGLWPVALDIEKAV